jgi:hypothetical protein
VALRRLGLRLRLVRILLTAGAAGTMALAVALLQWAGAPIWVLLAAAAIVYPAAVLLFRALRPGEVSELLRLRRREKVEPEEGP